MAGERGQWGSRTGFILAAAGSAVGLGNIWKFPYITGNNGGGYFVLIYLACIALIGLPILVSEIMIGRAAQKQAVGAYKVLQGGPTGWSFVGWLGVIAGALILSFYIVVAGWAMDYTLKSVANFSAPIAAKAQATAMKYRADTSVDQMRLDLTAIAAYDAASAHRENIRQTYSPEAWRTLTELSTAVDASTGTDLLRPTLTPWTPTAAEATCIKAALGDPDVGQRWTLDGVVAVANELGDSTTEELTAANDIAAMSDEEVIESATARTRRSVISKEVTSTFLALLNDGWTSSFWAVIFMFTTIIIVAGGVSRGIERACRVMMPLLIALMCLLVVYGFFQPGFSEALAFVFQPDAGKLKASGVLEALGHAFFTLSLGMGAMITYGSYQKSKAGLAGQSLAIAGLDTGIALLACMVIFPIIFTYDQDPAAGPGLVFMSMPLAFAEMGAPGMVIGIAFFGLLVMAALTSAISILEVVTSYFIDEMGWSRIRAAWVPGSCILLLGFLVAFSSGPGFLMSSWEQGFGMNFFDTLDLLASNWLLPLGGFFIAIYVGWVMPARLRNAQVADFNGPLAAIWLTLVRFVAPAMVAVVLLQKIGLINADQILWTLFH